MAGVAPVGFFAHPGHQEDVVVDAERDQEHEHEQRERGIGAAEFEHVVEEERADPQGGGEREDHRGGQDQRCHDGAQQQREDEEHHDEDEREQEVAVVRGCPRHVQEDRRGAAHFGVGTRDGVHRCPRRSIVVYAAWLSGGEVSVPWR